MGTRHHGTTLSLLTFNTLGTPFFAPDISIRYAKMAQLINESDYDIVFLQEIFTYYQVYLIHRHLKKKFQHAAYEFNFFGPRGGLIIFSKVPLSDIQFETFSFPKGATVPFYSKIAKQGILTAKVADFNLRIGTTHLASDVVHNLTPEDKLYKLIKSETEQTTELVKRYTKENISLILAGDFNIAKDSNFYSEFVTNSGVSDSCPQASEPTYDPKRISYIYKAQKPSRIDFVFTKSITTQIRTVSHKLVFKDKLKLATSKKSYLSDHIGLVCTLAVNE